jgi:hypothetical protein
LQRSRLGEGARRNVDGVGAAETEASRREFLHRLDEHGVGACTGSVLP